MRLTNQLHQPETLSNRPAPAIPSPMKRILGHSQGEQPGPCLVMMGGLHGNETAGLRAIERVFALLFHNKIPHRGSLWGIAGNLTAIQEGVRYLTEDLNRMWLLNETTGTPPLKDHVEGREKAELKALFEHIMGQTSRAILFLDLHTFSSTGSPFVIAADTPTSERLLKGLPFPAIFRLEHYIRGTLGTYLHHRGHNMLAFEGGSHDEPGAAFNLEAFLWHVLVNAGVVEPCHTPQVRVPRKPLSDLRLKVFLRHPVHAGDGFRMEPGFINIQAVKKGQLLARDNRGPILASEDAYLLMPLYHPFGEDGFFLARDMDAI